MATKKSKGRKTTAKGAGVDRRLARHGRLSYLVIPATDARRSAVFYENVLGWKVDQRATADFRFQDPTGMLIGRWDTGRAVSRDAGFLPFIYVQRVDEAVQRAAAHGGAIVKAAYPEGNLLIATVTDPAGNIIGLWQERA